MIKYPFCESEISCVKHFFCVYRIFHYVYNWTSIQIPVPGLMYANPNENGQIHAKCLPFFKISSIYAWKIIPFSWFREFAQTLFAILKFDRWHWKTIGHLFCATSSFAHHFVAIGEYKLVLQSGNNQFVSKSMIFWPAWPWNLTDDLEKQQGTSPKHCQAFVHFIRICEFKLELRSGNG